VLTSPSDTEIVPPPTERLVAELEQSGWVIAYQQRDDISYEEAKRAGVDFWFGADADGTEWWAAISVGASALAALAQLVPVEQARLALARCPSSQLN
jgi:hypothetical protein